MREHYRVPSYWSAETTLSTQRADTCHLALPLARGTARWDLGNYFVLTFPSVCFLFSDWNHQPKAQSRHKGMY